MAFIVEGENTVRCNIIIYFYKLTILQRAIQ